MDMRRRVRWSAGGIRTGTAIVSWAQQLFGAALVLVRRLGGQALSRVFPLCRSREMTKKQENTRNVKNFEKFN